VTALQNGFSSVLTAGTSKLECLSLVIKYEPHYTITILGSIIDIHFYGTFSTYSLNLSICDSLLLRLSVY
jgi:hypothetical protein